ncbi:MAG TPA: autotransporter outer membrane beta-barrel domain-containing protein [Xanthobacteraceae bacterium]|nr:autotransporter outer membrane beta-barrel domain-containing protein [Xanthobacteraceae bacterium]
MQRWGWTWAGFGAALLWLSAAAPSFAQVVPDPCSRVPNPCIGPIGPAVGGLISFGSPGSPLLALQYERLNEKQREEQLRTAGQPARAYAPPSATATAAQDAFGDPAYKAPPMAAEAPLGAALAWVRIVGRVGSSSATEDEPSTKLNGGGAFAGLDLPYDPDTRYGVALGYSRSFVETDSDEGKLDADGYHISAYATHAEGPWRMRLIGSYAYYTLDSHRDVVVGRDTYVAVADYNANNAEALAEISYVTAFGAFGVEPYAAVGLSWLDTDAFQETGAPREKLVSGPSFSDTWPYTVLGARFSTQFAMGTALVVPSLDLGWRHVFGDVDPQLVYSAASIDFAVSGVPIAEDSLMLGLGLDSSFANGWRGSLKYLGELAEEAQVHTFSAGLAVPF